MNTLEVAFVVIQGLLAIILASFGWWLAQLSGRVTQLEEDVSHYEANVGIGNEKLEAIHREIKHHVDREEVEVWSQMGHLRNDMGEVKVSLASMSAALTAAAQAIERSIQADVKRDEERSGLRDRMTRVEGRLDRVEKNGNA